MAEIPEHLLKRAQAAREKAESQQKTETTDSTQPQETEETKEGYRPLLSYLCSFSPFLFM